MPAEYAKRVESGQNIWTCNVCNEEFVTQTKPRGHVCNHEGSAPTTPRTSNDNQF